MLALVLVRSLTSCLATVRPLPPKVVRPIRSGAGNMNYRLSPRGFDGRNGDERRHDYSRTLHWFTFLGIDRLVNLLRFGKTPSEYHGYP